MPATAARCRPADDCSGVAQNVIHFGAWHGKFAYCEPMRCTLPTVSGLMAFVFAGSATGAEATSAVTGVTNTGPGLIILAAALGLLLTLILRPTVASLSRAVAHNLGQRRMRRLLLKSSSHVLHNFILPGAYGGLTRIDHAVLVAGSIVCIQTRHLGGKVLGKADDPQWTHVSGGHKRKFLNPQIQNEGRAAALRKVAPDIPVSSLVVFTANVELPANRAENVIRIGELSAYLNKLDGQDKKPGDCESLWLTVRSAAQTDQASHRDFDAQLSFG